MSVCPALIRLPSPLSSSQEKLAVLGLIWGGRVEDRPLNLLCSVFCSSVKKLILACERDILQEQEEY